MSDDFDIISDEMGYIEEYNYIENPTKTVVDIHEETIVNTMKICDTIFPTKPKSISINPIKPTNPNVDVFENIVVIIMKES